MKLLLMLAATAALFADGPIADRNPHDGDTVWLHYAGKSARIRHIDAPEMAAGNRRWPEQPFAQHSRLVLQHMLQMNGNPRAIERGRDKYRRILIDIEPEWIQRTMVAAGWAWATDDKYKKEMLAAQKAKRGLWAGPCVVKPSDWRNKGKRCPVEAWMFGDRPDIRMKIHE